MHRAVLNPSPSARSAPSRRRARGFTLIELLVVTAIAIIIISLTFPMVQVIIRTTRAGTGVNTISTAAAASRAYLHREVVDLRDQIPGARYAGTALLFTPSGEIRLVENRQTAVDSGGGFVESRGLNAYGDIPDRDYIMLPRNIGVLGVTRNANGMVLIAPPFAVRFDRSGQLVVADYPDPSDPGAADANGDGILDAGPSMVYYDGDYDGAVRINISEAGSWRGQPEPIGSWTSAMGYNPNLYDPTNVEYLRNPTTVELTNPSTGETIRRAKLPFDAIETVIGVLTFDKNNFRARFNDDIDGNNNGFLNDPWDQIRSQYVLNANTFNPSVNPWFSNPAINPDHAADSGAFAINTRNGLSTLPEGWLLVNGDVRFFNRNTGALVQDWKPRDAVTGLPDLSWMNERIQP